MRYCYFVIGLFFFQWVQAQPLPRKASLGARVAPTENGLTIQQLAPEGTLAQLGAQKDDRLLQVNDQPITDLETLRTLYQQQLEGEPVTLRIERAGTEQVLSGTWAGRPRETADNATVHYDRVPFRGGHLSAIVTQPLDGQRFPAVLFVPGYTCSSVDALPDYHPYKRIIDAYKEAGYVTFRVEKSGLGDSQNTPACASCHLLDEIENFEAGLLHLKSLPYVDTNQIIVYGHSMGGIVAPALSARHNVAGVVVYGTSAKSWFEYQLGMYRVQNALADLTPLEVEQSVRDQYALNYRFFVQKEALADIAQDTALARMLTEEWSYDGKNSIYGRNKEYWRQIQDLPLLHNWKDTRAPVLVQFGESDFQAYSKADHEQIVETVNYYHPGHATLRTFPQTDHYFARSGTMQQAYDAFMEGRIMDLFEAYNPAVGESAVTWSDRILKRS